MDFLHDQLATGQKIRVPTVVDTFSSFSLRWTSERGEGATLGQHRSTQRKTPRGRADEERLTAGIVALARQWLLRL